MAKVRVSPKVLKWALSRSGIGISDLEPKLKNIRELVSGTEQPTFSQLEFIARRTDTPLGYLLLDEPPKQEIPIPYYRTLQDDEYLEPSPELLDTIYDMQLRQSWLREFLLDTDCEPLSFVGAMTPDSSPAKTAKFMNQVLGFTEAWSIDCSSWEDAFRLLRESMETAGITVVVNGVVGNNTRRRLKVEEFRGFVLVDEYAPLAFVNGSDAKAAQMFTLAHELAHVCYGSSAAFDLREIRPSDVPIEQSCNEAAAEFLVPASRLLETWTTVSEIEKPFQTLARLFKVSELVAARRTLDLGLISKSEFFAFYRAYRARDHRKTSTGKSGGNFYATQNMRVGRKFASSVILAVKSEKLLYQDAYRLTGLNGKTFQRYAESLGYGGV